MATSPDSQERRALLIIAPLCIALVIGMILAVGGAGLLGWPAEAGVHALLAALLLALLLVSLRGVLSGSSSGASLPRRAECLGMGAAAAVTAVATLISAWVSTTGGANIGSEVYGLCMIGLTLRLRALRLPHVQRWATISLGGGVAVLVLAYFLPPALIAVGGVLCLPAAWVFLVGARHAPASPSAAPSDPAP